MKVHEAALGRAYDLDLSLVDAVEAVRAAADAARAAGASDAHTSLAAVTSAVDRLDERLREREAILGGFS